MSQALTNTIVVFIGLVMFSSSLIFIYTIAAEQLEDDDDWLFWKRTRSQLSKRWSGNRVIVRQHAHRRPPSHRER
jgi:hypothetical protein